MTLFKSKYRVETTRLKGWDYRNASYYFVTICAYNREHYFGAIEQDDVSLSAIGDTAAKCWAEIPKHHAGIELDEWVVMPNHVHGIVVITPTVETLHCNVSTETRHVSTTKTVVPHMSAISPKTGSLSVVMRSYKSAVTTLAHEANLPFKWQARFWDHIIRNEAALNRVRNYIRANPANWAQDRNITGVWM
jgi:REP element-mobilizing transposase RayT